MLEFSQHGLWEPLQFGSSVLLTQSHQSWKAFLLPDTVIYPGLTLSLPAQILNQSLLQEALAPYIWNCI